MSDLSSYTCPKCGGQLQITPYTRSVECPYCGTEHALPRQYQRLAPVKESLIVCPVCQRNDRSEKIEIAVRREHDRDAESKCAKALAAPDTPFIEMLLRKHLQKKNRSGGRNQL